MSFNTRQEIFQAINSERQHQDEKYPRDERRKDMYKWSAPHIILLEEYVYKLRSAWVAGGMSEDERIKGLLKIATLAVRALEEVKQ